jgi:uncharacterized protein YjgD (DUF1641 family)
LKEKEKNKPSKSSKMKTLKKGYKMKKEEILKEFKNIEGINEAKKIYKTLAKKLHPDILGGDEERFKLLNSIYTDLIEYKIYFILFFLSNNP